MFDVVWEWGAESVTVSHVVERSGVSRRTFYEIFDDCENCFFAAFEDALAYACERVLPAYEAHSGWRERIRAALIALLAFLDGEPVIGRLLIVESRMGGGERTSDRRAEVLAEVTRAIDRGGAETKAILAPPLLIGEGLVGGVLSVVESRLGDRRRGPLVELANPLMGMIVLPYLGAAAARRELERPVPSPPSPVRSEGDPLLADPFKAAGIRLTYRTVRALVAIAAHPGASNRLVADVAEIKDQGQISKLLTRLERAGMVANTGVEPGQGGPNAWTLTSVGREVVSNIRTQERPTASSEGGAPRCSEQHVST
jgi:AcrR family transcriptional regulator